MEVKEASAAYAELSALPVDSLHPGYKHTEVGVIPDDWDASIIGALANTSSGTTPPRSMSERYFSRGDIPWVKTLDLNNSEIRETDEKVTVAALSETSLQVYPTGSVLVAMYGGYNQIGRAGLLRVAAAVNQALTAIVPNQRVLDSTYLLHTLNYRVDYWRVVASSSRKDPNITGKDVAQFPLALPSIREQEAIAEALSDADALIESLEQLIAKKRHIKQGTMQALLTGRQRLPGFDDNWRRKALSELFDFSGGYSASRDQLSADGHCYLHYGDIHTSSKSFVDVGAESQELPRLDISINKVNANSLLKDGDVVFVDASEDDEGTSKHVVIINKDNVPFISGLHTIVAKSKTSELDHAFRRYCFQTPDIKQQFCFFAVGTKVSGVSKSNIGKIQLSFPPVAEQRAIASILTGMDTELAELETRLAKTRQLKQGMMQELLTGRIRLV